MAQTLVTQQPLTPLALLQSLIVVIIFARRSGFLALADREFHVLGTPKTSSVAEKCADGKQSLFIFHVLESVERRSRRDARSSLNEP